MRTSSHSGANRILHRSPRAIRIRFRGSEWATQMQTVGLWHDARQAYRNRDPGTLNRPGRSTSGMLSTTPRQ